MPVSFFRHAPTPLHISIAAPNPALTGEVEVGVDLNGVVAGSKAQVFCHRRRINNLAGVHNARWIKCPL